MDLSNSHTPGLLKALQSMLNHLLGISDLKSWSIYQNKGGLVTLNIRFSHVLDDNLCDIDMPTSYRKVSARQVMRSRQRAQDHNTQKHGLTLHTDINPSMAKDTPSEHQTSLKIDAASFIPSSALPTIPKLLTPPKTLPKTHLPQHQADGKKRKLDTLSPEVSRTSTSESPIQRNMIDSPEILLPKLDSPEPATPEVSALSGPQEVLQSEDFTHLEPDDCLINDSDSTNLDISSMHLSTSLVQSAPPITPTPTPPDPISPKSCDHQADHPGPEPKHMDLLKILCEGLRKVGEAREFGKK